MNDAFQKPTWRMMMPVSREVDYLPKPNSVTFVTSTTEPPVAMTASAFMIPMIDTDHFVFANNRRRGIELAGGHREAGETLPAAAIREAWEETGYRIIPQSVRPFGYLRMETGGEMPKGYRYPFPISYQAFFVGAVEGSDPYCENDECLKPVVLRSDDIQNDELAEYARAAKREMDGFITVNGVSELEWKPWLYPPERVSVISDKFPGKVLDLMANTTKASRTDELRLYFDTPEEKAECDARVLEAVVTRLMTR